jgi:glycosyltransferase involved in cell wall biosynthesis
METLRLALAAALALVALAALIHLVWGYLNIPSLRDVPPAWPVQPRVSVIVAARDEERHIGAAVASLLLQSYPDFELIVVDDRSTDGTAGILDGIAREHQRLRVIHVQQLPTGWLGKNHALHLGAGQATGQLLLFADADVMLESQTLSRAVRLATIERADHVAVAPDLVLPTWPLALVVNYFMMWFLLWLRPWNARDPQSRAFIGIGAFNLVSADVYRDVGGYARIPLRPDDDIMLGKLLKSSGYRQILASGEGEVSVEWYRTLGELARGFRKNAFAGLQYSTTLAIGSVVANLTLGVWPFAAVWLTTGVEQLLYAVAVVAQVSAYAGPAWIQRTRPWLAILYPFAALIFVGILGAAVLRTLRRRGIEWRGTHYSLDELRANRL